MGAYAHRSQNSLKKKIIFIDSFRTAWSVRWPFISAKESMSLSPQILPHLSDIL
jgi:hypothetical protein